MEHLIASARKSAVDGMEYFLRNFSHVPDEKLTWSPTPTAKSAIRIAAHTALYAGRFASMLRQRSIPVVGDLAAWLEERNVEEVAITSRQEVESVFRKGTNEFIEALETLTPEEVGMSLDSGQGWSMPMTQLMNLAGFHAILHAGQIDFLQTCWDDQHIYV